MLLGGTRGERMGPDYCSWPKKTKIWQQPHLWEKAIDWHFCIQSSPEPVPSDERADT